MDNNGGKSSNRISSSSRRLLFDRRYGWVFDQWKDPSEEALAGGRGMFCILPIAKGFLSRLSQSYNIGVDYAHSEIPGKIRKQNPELITLVCLVLTLDRPKYIFFDAGTSSPPAVQGNRDGDLINLGARTAVAIIEKPELLSPKALQEGLSDQLHKLTASIKKPELHLFGFTEDSQTPALANALQLDRSGNRENC